jgi:hypothetical protein
MPQAASVNDDHARAQRQTGQEFHRSQSNNRRPAGQPSIFVISSLGGFLSPAAAPNPNPNLNLNPSFYWFDAVSSLSLFSPDGIKNPDD